ncbi:PAS-domain containing protein [Roseibium sp. AS2]|uniref:sensor domain-containing diguanylate cyclase n=1 Tax=Roseibium sp. AS2 TaxID=3135781 RepID=UPI0031800CC0
MTIVQGKHERERIEALRALQILHSERLPEYNAVVEAAAGILDCPISLIALVDVEEQWFKARYGLDAEGTERSASFCQHAILSDDIFVVPDAETDDRFKNNRLVTGEPHIRFYAGCPLSIDGRNRLGTLCVIDTKPRIPTRQQLEQLRRLATAVEGLIKAHRFSVQNQQTLIEMERHQKLAAGKHDLLQEVTSVSGVGGWEIDLNTNVVTWTDKTCEIHEVESGFQPDVKTALSFYPEEYRDEITTAVNRGIKEGIGWDLELPFITAKGRHTWVRAVGRPILENGTVSRLVGAFQDITERNLADQAVRLSEAVHRATLEALTEGILLLDQEGRIQAFNPAAATLLGNQKDLKGKAVQDLDLDFSHPAPDPAVDLNPLMLAAREPEKIKNRLVKLSRCGQSEPVWLRLNAQSIADIDHAPGQAGVVVSLTDITETKQQADTLQTIFDHFPGGIAYYGKDLRLESSNDEFRRLLDVSQEFTDGRPALYDFFTHNAKRGDYGPGDIDALAQERYSFYDLTTAQVFERQTANGVYIETRSTPLPSGGLIHNFYDITDRKLLEKLLAENERTARHRWEELDAVLANMRQGVSVFDAQGRLTLWNKQYVDLFSKPEGEVQAGVSITELVKAEKVRGEFKGNVHDHVMDLMTRLSAGDVVRSKFKHPNGKVISVIQTPLPAGGWIGTHEDVTTREQAVEKIEYAAHHDTLTGLANRTLFNATLEDTLRKVAALQCEGDLMLLDLDNFKPVNDAYGHDAGDEMLKLVAQRLRDCVRSSDLVARLGGDEFAIILSRSGSGVSFTSEIADRIVQNLQMPFELSGKQVTIGVSVGIAQLTGESIDVSSVIKRADIALYMVKKSGRNGYRFFDEAPVCQVSMQ